MKRRDDPQQDLFPHRVRDLENLYSRPDRAHARSTDPETSHAAASSMTQEKLSNQRETVFETLRVRGPMTDVDLVELLPLESPSGVRTRRRELVSAGLVEDTGGRETLPSGRKAIVWRVVAKWS